MKAPEQQTVDLKSGLLLPLFDLFLIHSAKATLLS